ncbi:hypothetical protein JCM11641_004018 [Rhodosporidiobolus odoratus]
MSTLADSPRMREYRLYVRSRSTIRFKEARKFGLDIESARVAQVASLYKAICACYDENWNDLCLLFTRTEDCEALLDTALSGSTGSEYIEMQRDCPLLWPEEQQPYLLPPTRLRFFIPQLNFRSSAFSPECIMHQDVEHLSLLLNLRHLLGVIPFFPSPLPSSSIYKT